MSTRVMPFAFFRCCGFRCFPLSSCSGKMNSLSRPLWRGQTDVPKIRAHTYGLIVSAFCGGAVSVFCAREASKNMSTRVIPFFLHCCVFRCFLLSSCGGKMDSSSRPFVAGLGRRGKNTRTLLCIGGLVKW